MEEQNTFRDYLTAALFSVIKEKYTRLRLGGVLDNFRLINKTNDETVLEIHVEGSEIKQIIAHTDDAKEVFMLVIEKLYDIMATKQTQKS